jgi:hypothetical protein
MLLNKKCKANEEDGKKFDTNVWRVEGKVIPVMKVGVCPKRL